MIARRTCHDLIDFPSDRASGLHGLESRSVGHDWVIKIPNHEFICKYARGRGCKGIVIYIGIFDIFWKGLLVVVARCLDEGPSTLVGKWEIRFGRVRAGIWGVDVGVRGG